MIFRIVNTIAVVFWLFLCSCPALGEILPTGGRDLLPDSQMKSMQAYMLEKRFDGWMFSGQGAFDDLEGEFFASPLVKNGRIHLVDKAAKYYVLDGASGKTILSRVLDLAAAQPDSEASVYSSPCLAGDRLFISDDSGQTIVLKTADEDAAITRNALPAGSGGTPTFSGKRMFSRGGEFLYCLAVPPKG